MTSWKIFVDYLNTGNGLAEPHSAELPFRFQRKEDALFVARERLGKVGFRILRSNEPPNFAVDLTKVIHDDFFADMKGKPIKQMDFDGFPRIMNTEALRSLYKESHQEKRKQQQQRQRKKQLQKSSATKIKQ